MHDIDQPDLLEGKGASKLLEPLKELKERVEANGRRVAILPSVASWFSMDDIHEIEMRALP